MFCRFTCPSTTVTDLHHTYTNSTQRFQVTPSGDYNIVWDDGHESVFNHAWLERHSFDDEDRRKRAAVDEVGQTLWAAELADNIPKADFG